MQKLILNFSLLSYFYFHIDFEKIIPDWLVGSEKINSTLINPRVKAKFRLILLLLDESESERKN